jgi:hypothetical protein
MVPGNHSTWYLGITQPLGDEDGIIIRAFSLGPTAMSGTLVAQITKLTDIVPGMFGMLLIDEQAREPPCGLSLSINWTRRLTFWTFAHCGLILQVTFKPSDL